MKAHSGEVIIAKDITIVGAGIVGMAAASYLRRDGHAVTVVDMRQPGEYCSAGNAGILSPGSCVPFGLPGNLKNVPRWLNDPLGPLAISSGYFLRVLPWLLRFQAASNLRRVNEIAPALRALLKQTFEMWAPLVQWAGVSELLRQTGYLVVYETEEGFRSDMLGWRIRREQGVVCEDIERGRIREMEPALRDIYVRGVFLPEQGHCANPLRLTQSLAAQFQRDGGRFVQREILGIDVGPDGPRALITDGGSIPVETLVICAGVHSNEFSARLGDRVPLESQRGYSVTYETPSVTLQRPVLAGERKSFVTPLETGLRVAGTVEFAGIKAPPNYKRADVLCRHAEHMLPELTGTNVTKWMGHRPQIPDSCPVIGRSSRLANVYYGFGHGHLGITAGAPTGRLIAELVGGRKPYIDIRQYRVDRF